MQIDELPGEDGQLDRTLVGVSPVNGKIFAFDVAQLPKLFSKTVELGEILFVTSQDADAPYALGLLRARRERPRRRRAAEQRDELASLHSITSSARESSVGGTVRPSALAVLRLMASSYLVGTCKIHFVADRLSWGSLLCCFAVWGTLAGSGPFARVSLNNSFLLLVNRITIFGCIYNIARVLLGPPATVHPGA